MRCGFSMTSNRAVQTRARKGGAATEARVEVIPFPTQRRQPIERAVVLVVSAGFGTGDLMSRLSGVAVAGPSDLTPTRIGEWAPDLVVSALIAGSHDALDIARALQSAGYRGRYRVVTTPLPHPALVLDELRVAGPGIDIDFMDWPI
jgi:hypothetical protein